MTRMILTRLGTAVLTVVLSATLVFLAVQLLPGDVAQQLLGQDATPEAVEALRVELGLDRPVWERYLGWLVGLFTGDFGTSLVTGSPIGPVLGLRLRNTLMIAIPTFILGVALAIYLGLIAGINRDKASDRAISGIALVGMSIPEFVTATLGVLLLAVTLPILPAVVIDGDEATMAQLLPSTILPVIVLTISMTAYILRMTRAGIIDTMASEFVTTAILKGVRLRNVVVHHALPTAILPTLNVLAINVAWLIGGVVVVEAVFNYPGLGSYMIEAVHNRDLPVIQSVAVVTAIIYSLANLAADIGAMLLDPRQRTRQEAAA
ncbi:MAG: ABC transporter permease [Acidobacteriota bacterium]|nr:ABC transporter permease [Acidobacteriota bacterium]